MTKAISSLVFFFFTLLFLFTPTFSYAQDCPYAVQPKACDNPGQSTKCADQPGCENFICVRTSVGSFCEKNTTNPPADQAYDIQQPGSLNDSQPQSSAVCEKDGASCIDPNDPSQCNNAPGCENFICKSFAGIGAKCINKNTQSCPTFCNTDEDCQKGGAACENLKCLSGGIGGSRVCRVPNTTNDQSQNRTSTSSTPLSACPTDKPLDQCRINTAIGYITVTVKDFVQSLFGIILSIAGGIALLLIIFSGYRMITSQGNPEHLQGARETLTSAIVGLLFIIFSLVILQAIGFDVLRIPGFQP